MIDKVSFGGKIPVYNFGIRNSDEKQNKIATLYNYDCEYEDELHEAADLSGFYMYNKRIRTSMEVKHLYYDTIKMLPPDIATWYNKDKPNSNFYIAKVGDNEPLGFCAVFENDGVKTIKYIETKPNTKYKYVGQGIIAAIAKEALKNGDEHLEITNPYKETIDFFVDKCGFNKKTDKILYMKAEELEDFIKKTQEKTSTNVIDLLG